MNGFDCKLTVSLTIIHIAHKMAGVPGFVIIEGPGGKTA